MCKTLSNYLLELNKDKIKKQVKKYALAHSEELKRYNQQYYQTNQKRLYKRHKAYSQIYNKTPKARIKTTKRIRKKLKHNLYFRLLKIYVCVSGTLERKN